MAGYKEYYFVAEPLKIEKKEKMTRLRYNT
jgi:hypothetical protein